MKKHIYTRVHDGVLVTGDEALTATGVLKEGYWVQLSVLMSDSALNSPTRAFMHDGQDKLTLSDSDRAYYDMVEFDQNAWRNPSGRTATPLIDGVQPVVLSDSETAWKAMVGHDQNAWKQGVKR